MLPNRHAPVAAALAAALLGPGDARATSGVPCSPASTSGLAGRGAAAAVGGGRRGDVDGARSRDREQAFAAIRTGLCCAARLRNPARSGGDGTTFSATRHLPPGPADAIDIALPAGWWFAAVRYR
jgi:hypothetical protein